MKKLFFISLCLLFLTACSTVKTNVNTKIDIQQYKYALLEFPDDSWNLIENISNRIKQLGFELIPSGSDRQPDLVIFIDYQTHWDVAYQSFNYFDISFEDAKTGDILVASSYVGRFGFNSCDAALDLVFEDLSKKLKKEIKIPNK